MQYTRNYLFKFQIVAVSVFLFIVLGLVEAPIHVIIVTTFVFVISWQLFRYISKQQEEVNILILDKLLRIQEFVNTSAVEEMNAVGINNEIRAQILQNSELRYMYLCAPFIVFIESIMHIAPYNPQAFVTFVKCINEMLRLKNIVTQYYLETETYPEATSEIFEECKSIRQTCNTILSEFTFSDINKNIEVSLFLNNVRLQVDQLIQVFILEEFPTIDTNAVHQASL